MLTSSSTPTLTHPITNLLNIPTHYDVIIVGAGVLGCAAAHMFATQGRQVLLIERDWSEPDRIVGELLQPGGVQALQKLGLDSCLHGIDSIPVHGYAVFQSKENVQLKYPKNYNPHTGYAFHHGRFVNNLRLVAKANPCITPFEATVNELLKSQEFVYGVSCSVRNHSSSPFEFYAPLTIVADGCFSKFRKEFIDKPIVSKSNFVGLVLKDVVLPYPNHGHVILADPSPILLYQIGSRDTRILVDVPGALPSVGNGALKKYLKDFVAPQLPKSVQDSFYDALESQRIRSMPNSWLPPTINTHLGVMVLGDAMNMRHPLTGGGMTVALWDVIHYGKLLEPLPSFENAVLVKKLSKRFFWIRKSTSSVINVLAQALYALFSAGENVNLLWLQKACFGYFKLGGRCASTPVGLLAGLIHEPLTLIGHFFAVALYGTFMILTSQPFYMLPWTIFRACMVLLTAVTVITPVLLAEIKG